MTVKAVSTKDDRTLPATRLVAILVIPFLLLAFLILYLFPHQSGERFAWQIQPDLTAMFVGAGYLGGAYFFFRVAFTRQWHRLAAGFPAVTGFTWVMLLATLLHWERFDLSHFPFQLWLVLNLVTPFLLPWVWLRNRGRDPALPEPGDLLVPASLRAATGFIGLLFLLCTLAFMLSPVLAIAFWPWQLTPLTARVIAGWFALFGIGAIALARDRRWSAWLIEMESVILWHVLVLVAVALRLNDFYTPLNWFLLGELAGLLAFISIYIGMRAGQRKTIPGTSS